MLIISNFIKTDNAIVNDWYEYLDDKLISGCVESVLQSRGLSFTEKILSKNLKEAYRHKGSQKEKDGRIMIMHNGSAFIKK